MNNPFYQLNIASIVLTIVLFVIVVIRKSFPSLNRRIFKVFILLSFLSSSMELACLLLAYNETAIPNAVKYILVISYLAVHLTLHYVFLFYVNASARNKIGSKIEKIIFTVIYVLALLFLFTTPWHKLAFSYDTAGKYILHPCGSIFEIIGGVSILYALVITIKHHKVITKLNFVVDVIFLLAWIAALISETIFYGIYVENFTIAISATIVCILTDNPDVYFVGKTGVFNDYSFSKMYSDKIENKQPFKLLAFTFKDFDLYIQRFGSKRANVAIEQTLINCRQKYGQNSVFGLGRNVVVVDVGELNVDTEIEHIFSSCYKGGLSHNKELKLYAQFALIEYPQDVDNLSDLHDAIYMMLYDEEHKSGERITFFDKKILIDKHRRDKIILALHNAIDHNLFKVYYQPLYDWKNKKYIGLEALVRIDTLIDGKPISPGEFIPIAEEEGLIFQIDEIVFEKVCRFARNTSIEKRGIEFVDINLSLLKLLDTGTAERYAELASRYEIKPGFINLEITETAEADQKYMSQIRENIAAFREKGFIFSLDDYGSGYSTVIYMAEMDTKLVKIDASILWNAMKNKKYYTVLENCIRLIYCFDKECLVEGVETEKMVEVLQRLGVDYFQGYYYSKPLPEDELLTFLDQNGQKLPMK